MYFDGNGSENFPEKWDSRCSKFHRSYSNSSSVCIVMFCTKPDVLLITFFTPIKSHTESLLDTCLSVASPFPALCSQERCQLLEFFLSPCAFRLDDEDSAFENNNIQGRKHEMPFLPTCSHSNTAFSTKFELQRKINMPGS